MNVQTYLYFPGTCRAAIELYERAFEAELRHIMLFEAAPEPVRIEGCDHLVYHATLEIGETNLNLSDDPTLEVAAFGGFALLVHCDHPNELDESLLALGEGGQIELPAQETFWAGRYAIVIDRFGIRWKLQCAKPQS